MHVQESFFLMLQCRHLEKKNKVQDAVVTYHIFFELEGFEVSRYYILFNCVYANEMCVCVCGNRGGRGE